MSKMSEAVPAVEPKAEVRPSLDLTPYDHGRATGEIRDRNTMIFNGSTEPVRSPYFRAAEQLHGWNAHNQQSSDPLVISRNAFDKAIEAVKTPDERGVYTPHFGALAPHLQKVGS